MHGVFTAVIAMLTLFASVPLPVGSGGAYLNAGDAAIYLAAWALGPWGGGLTAAVGSALADILHGSLIYAPATFVIKGLMGVFCGLLWKKLRHGAPAIAGVVMPAGYFLYEILLYGAETALFGLWTNAIQYAFGVTAGILLIIALGRSRALRSYWDGIGGIRQSIRRAITDTGVDMLETGLTTGTGGNISVLDRASGFVYITPTTVPYHEIAPSDVPVFRLDGTPVDEPKKPSMELRMHINIYRARDDVSAVVHTHSQALIALAEQEKNLLGLPVAPPLPVGSRELAEGCIEHLGSAPAVLLRGHGAVTVGASLEEAYERAKEYEKKAEELLSAERE